MLSWEIIARGRVQGVGFRAHARRCAVQCGISGYAKTSGMALCTFMPLATKQLLKHFARYCAPVTATLWCRICR